jgi:hypothetical protein
MSRKSCSTFSVFRHRIYPMSHEDMLQLFDFERFLVDHVIPRDRETLYRHGSPVGRRRRACMRQLVRRAQSQIPRRVLASSGTDWRAPATVSEDRILDTAVVRRRLVMCEGTGGDRFCGGRYANVVPYPPEPSVSALITASSATTLWLNFLLSSRAFAAICLTASNSSRVTTSIVARRRSS